MAIFGKYIVSELAFRELSREVDGNDSQPVLPRTSLEAFTLQGDISVNQPFS